MRNLIHYAAVAPQSTALKILMDKGLDCRQVDKNRWNALMYACKAGRYENI